MSRIILLITLFFLQINTANSEVYKWLDENGKTVYGDKPTSNNVDKIKIKKPPKQDKHYQERYKKQQQLLNVMQEERDEKVSQKLEEMDKKQKKKEKCAKLIKELQEAKDASLLYEDTDDPNNPKILSDEERKAEEVKYEKYIKENCL
jgi:ribosomal protein S10